MIDRFSSLILNARSNFIPTQQHSKQTKISIETQQLISHKNAVKRNWQRTHYEPHKKQLKRELNRIQKQINHLVNNDINHQWSIQLQNINKGGRKLWKLAKHLKGKSDSTVSKIKIAQKSTTDDDDRASCLAEIFKKSHTLTSSFTHSNDKNVSNTVKQFESMMFFDCQAPIITQIEIYRIINNLKPFKSPGPDTIQNILLKKLPPSAINWLTHTINACIKLSYWPTSFKTAKIVPILKSGKPPSDAHSYRPISLLNSLGKILEKLIYSRLIDHIEDKQLLPDFQFGFRKGHSTIHQAMRIKQFIASNKRRKWSTGMVFLDVEKAFDSIWHDGLIYKLIKLKLPTFLIRMINAFIRNRKFAVQVNNTISDKVDIPAGLAQGTCISPILYSLFIADMPNFNKTELALYADDTAIFTSSKQSNTIIKRLSHALQTLELYFRQWKIKINADKTQATFFPFDNKRRRTPSIPLKYGNHSIDLQKSANYLGILFDSKLLFNQHITSANDKAIKCFRALYPLLAPKSRLSTDNKKLIYTSVIRPILTYGSPIWASAAHSHTQKFKVVQNKILKTIFKLPFRTPTSFVHKIAEIPNFNTFTNSLNTNFMLNCRLSDYNLIREIDFM